MNDKCMYILIFMLYILNIDTIFIFFYFFILQYLAKLKNIYIRIGIKNKFNFIFVYKKILQITTFILQN